MVFSVKDAPAELPVLADFLEEKFGLTATAALFRLRDLKPLPKSWHADGEFRYYPLADDVFLYLTEARYHPDPKVYGGPPCTFVGLYAHPEGAPARWAKVTGMLGGKDESKAKWPNTWRAVRKPDSRVEAARAELDAHARARRH
jgi:hypothetical protein